MAHIFLESHNIKNLFFGFGQFNYHLLKNISQQSLEGLQFTVHGKDLSFLKNEFGDTFKYKKYHSLSRYPTFRIRKKYDLWHSLNQNTKIEPYHKIPYLLTVHNISYIKDINDYKTKENHIRFQEKLHRSKAISYISEYAKTSTHQFFEVPNVPEYVIYNGNPIEKKTLPDTFKPRRLPKRSYLFSIGEFTDRKNFQSLIPMLVQLPEFDLVLAGKNTTSNAEKVRHEIEKHKLTNRVFLVGKISDDERQYYYEHCAAFVFPSLREGFGLPVIEAMTFGKPVFISNNTSLPEIGGDHAFYWDHYDPEYMTSILKAGLNTFENNKTEFENVYKKRAASFTWSNSAEQYLKMYREILAL